MQLPRVDHCKRRLRRITAAFSMVLVACFLSSPTCHSQEDGYKSPYRLNFSVPMEELCAIDQQHPRNNLRLESKVPFEEWYSPDVRKRFGAWGPDPRHYPALDGFEQLTPSWKRQRVLAVASHLIGLPYQHHHIPDWDPPASWPWKEVAYGRNSKGMDCSDFTSWLYNYGMGIHLSTGIGTQAEKERIAGPGGQGFIDVRTIRDDNGYDDLVAKLKSGDLLYIKNNQGKVGHVIMWVGELGESPDGSPLIIDCTGSGHKDSTGNDIPIGVHIRPFLKNSWYYHDFSHAHRIIGEPLRSDNS